MAQVKIEFHDAAGQNWLKRSDLAKKLAAATANPNDIQIMVRGKDLVTTREMDEKIEYLSSIAFAGDQTTAAYSYVIPSALPLELLRQNIQTTFGEEGKIETCYTHSDDTLHVSVDFSKQEPRVI